MNLTIQLDKLFNSRFSSRGSYILDDYIGNIYVEVTYIGNVYVNSTYVKSICI